MSLANITKSESRIESFRSSGLSYTLAAKRQDMLKTDSAHKLVFRTVQGNQVDLRGKAAANKTKKATKPSNKMMVCGIENSIKIRINY